MSTRRVHPPKGVRKTRLKSLQGIFERITELRPKHQFGPVLSTLGGCELADVLVIHRLTKGFEIPTMGNPEKRKSESISAVLLHDSEGFVYHPPVGDIHYLRARSFIRTVCMAFKPSYSLVFPTGESAVSTGGTPEFIYKLEDEKYWECSPASFSYVCKIFYNNPHMRQVVKKKYYAAAQRDFGFNKDTCVRKNRERFGYNGYKVFKHMLSLLVTLRDTSRLATVPKDNSRDRVITCEPFLTMVCQLSVMRDIRQCLIRVTGVDLRVLQDWHGARIRSGVATIDLKNASNSLWNVVVKDFFGSSRLGRILQDLRTGVTQDGDDYHHFNMFSPMGCGLTFDVMTLILMGIARGFDPSATVFGDDIVIRSEYAPLLCNALSTYGFVVNESKTFINGNFRESCGYFCDLSSQELLVSFEATYPQDLSACYTLANKIFRILEANQVSPGLKQWLQQVHEDVVRLVPADALALPGYHTPRLPDGFVLVKTLTQSKGVYSRDLQRLIFYHWNIVKTARVGEGFTPFILDRWRLLRMRDGLPKNGTYHTEGEKYDMYTCSNHRVTV